MARECEFCHNWRYEGHASDFWKRIRGYYKRGICLWWRTGMPSIAVCPKWNEPLTPKMIEILKKSNWVGSDSDVKDYDPYYNPV